MAQTGPGRRAVQGTNTDTARKDDNCEALPLEGRSTLRQSFQTLLITRPAIHHSTFNTSATCYGCGGPDFLTVSDYSTSFYGFPESNFVASTPCLNVNCATIHSFMCV